MIGFYVFLAMALGLFIFNEVNIFFCLGNTLESAVILNICLKTKAINVILTKLCINYYINIYPNGSKIILYSAISRLQIG